LAAYVEREPAWQPVQAFRGQATFIVRNGFARFPRILQRWGFEAVEAGEAGRRRPLRELGPNAFALCLMWAFNPASVKTKRLWLLRRDQVWISRRTLLAKAHRPPGG
jgi:hypothetical protein